VDLLEIIASLVVTRLGVGDCSKIIRRSRRLVEIDSLERIREVAKHLIGFCEE